MQHPHRVECFVADEALPGWSTVTRGNTFFLIITYIVHIYCNSALKLTDKFELPGVVP